MFYLSMLEQVSYQQIKQEREANEIFPRIKRAPAKFFQRKQVATAKGNEQQQLPGGKLLGAYLYGGFTKDANVPDNTMENETKFHVPLSMFSRAEVDSKVKAQHRKKIQSARLDYMRIPQIPSDSDDENDETDEIIEDIKGLSLIRTPYFRIPTIMTQKKRRIDRIKNRHLKGNRLKRINMLLFDRKLSAEKNKQRFASDDEGYFNDPPKMVENPKMASVEYQPQLGSRESSPLPAVSDKKKVAETFESPYRYWPFLSFCIIFFLHALKFSSGNKKIKMFFMKLGSH
jgi:hypothetical protein